MDEPTPPAAAQPPHPAAPDPAAAHRVTAHIGAARDTLATICVWGRGVPLPLRLAAAAAAAELQARAAELSPPAAVPARDPRLTEAAAAELLADARAHLHAAVHAADPVDAVYLALAARELHVDESLLDEFCAADLS